MTVAQGEAPQSARELAPTHTRRPLPWWAWLAVGAFGLLVVEAAVGGGLWVATSSVHAAAPTHKTPTASKTFIMNGTFALTDSTTLAPCTDTTGYSDIQLGTQVIVQDASGTTVAIGSLGAGEATGSTCTYTFEVDGVPKGSSFYGIEVSHRGFVQETASDAEAGRAALTQGN